MFFIFSDTSLHALRLCLENLNRSLKMDTLQFMFDVLSPLLNLPEISDNVSIGNNDYNDGCVDDKIIKTSDNDSVDININPQVSMDGVRIAASACVGIIIVKISDQDAKSQIPITLKMVDSYLFTKSNKRKG